MNTQKPYISKMSSVESLREVVRRLENTFNDPQIRESSYFDFYDDSLMIHGFPPNLPTNKKGFKEFIYLLWNAFPDIRITFEDIIVEGNKVVCRYNLTGTHKGDFMDLRPTNKQFKVNGMTIFSFRATQCIERWNLVDMISLIEQLRI
jgi:predicted ester cyclase